MVALSRPWLLVAACLAALVAVALLPHASAQLRGATLSVQKVSGNTVEVDGFLAAKGYAPAPGHVQCNELDYYFDDGTYGYGCGKRWADTTDGGWVGTLVDWSGNPVRHTFATAGAHTMTVYAYVTDGHSNGWAPMRLDLPIQVGSGSAPAFAFNPGVGCTPSTTCTFPLTATDADGDTVTYKLMDVEDQYGQYVQPSGMTVSSTGTVTWNVPAASGTDDTYSYAVLASDGHSSTLQVALVDLTAPACGTMTPSVVPGLSATPGRKDMALAWTGAPSSFCPLQGYAVERATAAAGPYSTVATLPTTATSYTDAGLTPCTTYYYHVSGVSTIGAGLAANVEAPLGKGVAPRAPTGLSAVSGAAGLTLSWTAPAVGKGCAATGYDVYRSDFTSGPILRLTGTATTVVDPSAQACQTYTYTVSAVSQDGEGAQSAGATIATAAKAQDAPTQLTVYSTAGSLTDKGLGARLYWFNPVDNGCGMPKANIYRDGVLVATVDMPAGAYQSYLDPGPYVPCVQAPVYWVQVVNSKGQASADSPHVAMPCLVTVRPA